MARVKFLTSVTIGGATLNAGTIDEVNDQSAKALVRDGAAEIVEDVEVNASFRELTPEELEAGKEIPAAIGAGTAEVPTDSTDMVVKALDAQYKRDELATAAKAIGVEFPYDAKKADVIAAVIAADKATALMK